jgi:hypothetical protein
VDVVVDPVIPGGNVLWVDITTPYPLTSTLVYLEFRAVEAVFGGGAPVILQRGSPVNAVTMQDPMGPLLCQLFDAEPDRYSSDNRSQNGCGGTAGGDGPVILGGFNRRSSIGPFPSGSGSPTGGN